MPKPVTKGKSAIPKAVLREIEEYGQAYEDHLVLGLASLPSGSDSHGVAATKKVNYRKLAFAHYEQFGQIACAHCGFGIRDVLEIAHLDCDRSNNDIDNLAILCPNCHKMHDLNMISTETIRAMREQPKVAVWSKRMKDAGKKAAATRAEREAKRKRQDVARRAAETRKRNLG